MRLESGGLIALSTEFKELNKKVSTNQRRKGELKK